MPPVSRAPRVVKTPSGERAIKISFALSLLTAAAMAAVFVLIGDLIDNQKNFPTILIGAMIVGVIVATISEFVRIYHDMASSAREEALLRRKVMKHLFLLGPRILEDEKPGSLVATCHDGIEHISAYRQTYLGTLWAGFAIPVLSVVVMGIFVDWVTALVLICFFPAVPLLLLLFKFVIKKFSPKKQFARNKLAAAYLEVITGLETLVLMNAAYRMDKRLKKVGEENRQAIMRMLAGNQLILFVVDAGFNLCLITTATVSCAIQASYGVLSTGSVISDIALTVLLLEPMDRMAGFFYVGMGGMANQRKIGKLFGEHPQMMHGPHGFLGLLHKKSADKSSGSPHLHPESHGSPHNPSSYHGPHHLSAAIKNSVKKTGPKEQVVIPDGYRLYQSSTPLIVQDGAVSIRHLNFSYQQNIVLDNLDLDVSPGEHVAIIGGSGAGKSTLFQLMKGIYHSLSGEIAIGKTVVRIHQGEDKQGGKQSGEQGEHKNSSSQLPVSYALRTASAYVAQSTWLFNATIRDNLLLACPSANEKQLWQACEQAHIAHDISSMPQGIDTHVGDQGYGMSGGQMQRISLARALLSSKKIILLDEPTSQVDLISEEKIIEAITQISAQKTVVMITHRLTSLRSFDRVYELCNGKLFDTGKGTRRVQA